METMTCQLTWAGGKEAANLAQHVNTPGRQLYLFGLVQY